MLKSYYLSVSLVLGIALDSENCETIFSPLTALELRSPVTAESVHGSANLELATSSTLQVSTVGTVFIN